MVSQERLRGNWNQVAGAVKREFGQITGDDLTRVRGSVDQLIGLIQEKTGQSREQIDAFLNDCCSNAGATLNRVSETASQYANAAGESIQQNYDRVAESAQQGYRQAVQTVSRRPVEALAVAVGAGLLAGLVFGLSLSRRRKVMQRPDLESGNIADEQQLIERMNAIRNASERHVVQMHLEAERLVDCASTFGLNHSPRWLWRWPPDFGWSTAGRLVRPSSLPATTAADKSSAEKQEFVARTSYASGAMAFVGTMAGNLLKQYVSNYVQEKLAGVQHDRNAFARGKTDEAYAERGTGRW